MDVNFPQPPEPSSKLSKTLIIAVVLVLICVIGFNLLIPIFGIAVGMAAGAWGLLMASVVIFCIGIMLLFIVPGILVLLCCLFALGWTILAIVLFPFIFPIILPLLIIMLFIAMIRKTK